MGIPYFAILLDILMIPTQQEPATTCVTGSCLVVDAFMLGF